MILTDRQIKDAIRNCEVVIEPYEENQIQPASYDLRIGSQGATTSKKKLIDIKNDGFLLLEPGDFGILTTFEVIKFNAQHVGRIGLRSKFSRKGIIATTGPQIDPGYEGRLIVGITNPTPQPVTLPFKDDILTIEIHRLEEPSTKPYSGPYQGKTELGPDDISMIVESESMALSEVLSTLNSLSFNVSTLNNTVGILTNDIKTIKWLLFGFIGFVSLLVTIIALIK